MMVAFVDLYQIFAEPKPAGAAGSLRCYLQPTAPAVAEKRLRPAVLIIPGGGYDHVSAREGEPVALRFLAKGFCAFVLDYSVAPLRYPAALREAAMALRYIRDHAEGFGIDPARVAVTGFSAGGHLAGLLGTMFDDPTLADLGTPDQLKPDALGLCYPVAVSRGRTHEGSFAALCGGDGSLRDRLSLDKLARADMPPVFLWHTRDDPSVPCRGSLLLAARLEELGVEFSLHIYRHGPHGLSTADAQAYPADRVPGMSWDVPGWIDAEIRFFEEIGVKIRDLEG